MLKKELEHELAQALTVIGWLLDHGEVNEAGVNFATPVYKEILAKVRQSYNKKDK